MAVSRAPLDKQANTVRRRRRHDRPRSSFNFFVGARRKERGVVYCREGYFFYLEISLELILEVAPVTALL